MNIHVSEKIQEKYPQYEFIGIPFEDKNGRKLIRSHHKILKQIHYYSFEEEFFWFDWPENCWMKKA